ncbi:MAG TPA: hypothetical protein VG650_18005 [Mycobacteriales bacterium]|nr:hypothetical protein [Mycobacteriales bacterium]
MDKLELLVSEAFGDGVITEVIRPSAIVPEDAARNILIELAMRDVRLDGNWWADPATWRRYDKPWDGPERTQGTAELLGSIQIAYGTPTRYEITIYRVSVTRLGAEQGMTVDSLTNEALAYGGLTLESCPRADLKPPPQPFRLPDQSPDDAS